MAKGTSINDSIHGLIRMSAYEKAVINLWRKTHMLACGMKAAFFLLNAGIE